MALSRKFLSALGIDADKIDEIIAAHAETVESLKEQRDGYKADAEKLAGVTNERDNLKEKLKETTKATDEKYNALKADFDKAKSDNEALQNEYNKTKSDNESLKNEFETFKADVSAKETKAKVEKAYREILREVGISEKRINSIVRVTNFDDMKLDEKGGLEGIDALKENAKSDWADFIETKSEKGAEVPTPPNNPNEKKPSTTPSRAAQLSAQYHNERYGTVETNKGE